jgi:hypothetical protein
MTIPVQKPLAAKDTLICKKNQEKSGSYCHFLQQPPDLVGKYPEADQPLSRSLLDAV